MHESGSGRATQDGTPIVLRLLPHVHHPPARVWVPEGEAEARALDARGYRVVAGSSQPRSEEHTLNSSHSSVSRMPSSA